MRKIAIIILTISALTATAKGPGYGYHHLWKEWNDNVLIMANSANKTKDLSHLEKDVVFYINLARMNGPLFEKTFLNECIKQEGLKGRKYMKSLRRKLRELPKLPPLKPKEDLVLEAKFHAKDMGRSGKKGHRSSDGQFFHERVAHLKNRYSKVKECNEYGDTDAMLIVVYLLIDETCESETRRRMILQEDMKYIGVGSNYHSKRRYNTVMLFAGEEKEHSRPSY